MGFLKSIIMSVALASASFAALASNSVVFSCDTEDGKQTILEYNKDENKFTMSRGNNVIAPELTVVKSPNNMGTSYNASRTENFTQREVYIPDDTVTYVLGYSEQGDTESGFVQIMESGTQVSYHECKPVSFHARFNQYDMFEDMTNVD